MLAAQQGAAMTSHLPPQPAAPACCLNSRLHLVASSSRRHSGATPSHAREQSGRARPGAALRAALPCAPPSARAMSHGARRRRPVPAHRRRSHRPTEKAVSSLQTRGSLACILLSTENKTATKRYISLSVMFPPGGKETVLQIPPGLNTRGCHCKKCCRVT
jgi:hypothetical protein